MATLLRSFDFRQEPSVDEDSISVTRDSEASYYGSDGYLHFSNKGRELIVNSQSFTGNSWNRVGVTASVPGDIAVPDGSSSGNKITESVSRGEHRISRGLTITKGTPVTISIYAKAGNRSSVQFSFLKAASFTGGNPGIRFNLASGKLLSRSSNVISYEAIDAGNGWWRLKVTGLPDRGSESGVHLYILNDSTSMSYDGSAEKYIYAWGAQIEQGATLSDYTAFNGLRFNHDLSGKTPKLIGALIEPLGTNYTPYSQILTHSSWRKQYATVVSSGKAPDGSSTAYKIKEDSTRGVQHYIMPYPTLPTAIGNKYTFSAFLKAAEHKWAFFNINGVTVHFDLQHGEVGNRNDIFSPSIESAGNGWYRCSATFLALLPFTSAKIGPEPANGNPTYNGSGNSGVLVWGVQFERSPSMSSYIRTTSNQSTRSADNVKINKPEESSKLDIFVQRATGGTWINNVDGNYDIPLGESPVQVVNFYNSGESVSTKDSLVQSLFAQEYKYLGNSGMRLSIMGTEYQIQTPNKPWSIQYAVNKSSPVFRVQVNAGDLWDGDADNPKEKERCEFYMKNADLPFNEDVWISYAMKIAPGTPLNLSPVEWCYLGQVHATEDPGDISTGPILGFRLEGEDTITAYTASSSEDPIKRPPTYIPRGKGTFTRGVWHKVVIRARFTHTDNAELQWWQNGKELVNVKGIGMGYKDKIGPYWKFGVYRSAMSPTVTVEYANMEVRYGSSLLSRIVSPLLIS
ncbi:phage head spike fiber domain-containing protein [Dyadobacter sandarakinus]|uniref:Heparin lyase I family protein n=1 Tax=Dyadobacter sandarakinus TaxID=2747268 RepID=A0ABX7I0D0_9BACT|nr:heparin lyase I family protein [Dyadobacter sandarakinus]QRQ99461.1 heparin lyase I family protein [Dyadobacter sandarakinus]